jgi:hypothetical protein
MKAKIFQAIILISCIACAPPSKKTEIRYSEGSDVDTLIYKGKRIPVIFTGTREGDGVTWVDLHLVKNADSGRRFSNCLPCFYYMKTDSTYEKVLGLKFCDYSEGTAVWRDIE